MRLVLSLDTSKPDFQPCARGWNVPQAQQGQKSSSKSFTHKNEGSWWRVRFCTVRATWSCHQTQQNKLGMGFPILLLGKSHTEPFTELQNHPHHPSPEVRDKTLLQSWATPGWEKKSSRCRWLKKWNRDLQDNSWDWEGGTQQQDLLCLAFGLGKSAGSSKLLLITKTFKPSNICWTTLNSSGRATNTHQPHF